LRSSFPAALRSAMMRNYAFNPEVEQSRQVVHSGELGRRRGQPGIDFGAITT
jgi:hypothetical protein